MMGVPVLGVALEVGDGGLDCNRRVVLVFANAGATEQQAGKGSRQEEMPHDFRGGLYEWGRFFGRRGLVLQTSEMRLASRSVCRRESYRPEELHRVRQIVGTRTSAITAFS